MRDRREAGLHELAVPRVIGRIGVHHRRRARVLDADLERQDALARAEGFGVAGDRDHVGVLRDRPVAELRVPRERRLAPQACVVRERIAGVEARLFERRRECLARSRIVHAGKDTLRQCRPRRGVAARCARR